MEALELTGEIEAPHAWAVADVVVRANGRVVHEGRHRERFALRTGERAVEIDADEARLEGTAAAIERGTWAEVSARVPALVAGIELGPHVLVEVSITGHRAGATVTVRGEVLEREAAGGSYRHEAVVSRARASVIATRSAERPAPARSGEASSYALHAAGALFAAAIVVVAQLAPVGGVVVEVVRTAWTALGLVLGWACANRFVGAPYVRLSAEMRQPLPVFRALAPEPTVRERVRHLPAIAAVLFATFGLPWTTAVMLDLDVAKTLPPLFPWAGALATLAIAVGVAIASHRRAGPARRAVRAVLSAPERRSGEAGWRAFTGTFEAASSLRVESHVRLETKGSGRTRYTDAIVTTRATAPATARVVGSTGALEVRLQGASVATPRVSVTERGARCRFEVDPGDAVLVVGVFRAGSETLEASGPESLLVIGTPPGTSARSWLRVRLALQLLPWVLLAAAPVGSALRLVLA